MTITKAEARQLVRMLDVASEFLESAIDAAVVPDTGEPRAEDAANCRRDRRNWRAVEDWKIKLQAAK
jgi:hypothetical protein